MAAEQLSGSSGSSWGNIAQLTKEEFLHGPGSGGRPHGEGQPSADSTAKLHHKEVVDDRSKELLSSGRALEGLPPSVDEITSRTNEIGAGRVEVTALLTDLILSMLFVDGDLAARSHMLSLLEKKPTDLELCGILHGMLQGTGRHQSLHAYISEFLKAVVVNPQVAKCWNNPVPSLRSNLRIAVAVVGDSIALFASAPKVYSKHTVSQCIRAAIQCELQDSAPRDMTPDEKQAFVCAGLDCFVFKDFVRGGAGTQKPPQCEPEKSLHPTLQDSQAWLEARKAEGYFALTLFL
jgi:hypothetical protein